MKFWRSSTSRDEDGVTLAEDGHALGLQSAVSLLHGREVAVEPWKQIAERHQRLTASAAGKPLQPESDAAGILAQVICSPNTEIARTLAGRIPSVAECDLYALVADTIIWDRVSRSTPGVAEPHARLAHSLYALMARYYQNADAYLAGSLRIVSEYIEFFGSAKTCRGTFAEASALTAGTSHLASKYGIYRHVDPVIAIGDAVLAENTGVSGRDAVGFSIVANNLANLHIALAEDQPPAGTHHYGKALACGEAALVAIDAATGDDVQTLRETTLQKLTQLHVRLAMDDGDAGDHASQARRLAEEYASAAADRAAAVEWVARILEVLEANRSASSDAGYSTRAARRRVELSRAVERIGEWVQESEQRIAAAKDTSERVRIASETVGSVYDDLTAGLERVTSVSGFDWSVCKMLLALGAIASGRLGDLTEPLVRSWLTNPYSPHDTEPPTAFQARQYMITGGGKADPADAAGRIVGLAMLAEWVQRNATDLPFREMLRSHNSGLLTRIVVGRPVFQECSGPALSPEADVDALLRTVHGIFDRASTTRAAQSSEPLKPPAQPARMGNP